ncbi:MAG: hypothetical protein COV52_09255 [Gammaproteobacteria bacterium CG11_big_fil_rev_8_21_14_0_20_46_22]|nr:MAG: hypothetical protein COW05_06995 [Gammaproteobacteria bacterium CG12_big_fil_rev_8_21_14_0_65_46_12]PIR10318.1 MAG: hypothetical protein COV52_09255 [Gammaproteobacteria bacterium CG11_big_fil_rev_8_21_14_0_20_46_22]
MSNALNALIDELGLRSYFNGQVNIDGQDPMLASPHKLGEAVSTALLLGAAAGSAIWKMRTGQDNDLSIRMCDAIHFLHPVHFIWQNGYSMDVHADSVDLNYHYLCRDGRRVWIQCGPPYAKLQNGYLNFFNCGNNKKAIAERIVQWNSFELEEKLAELGLPCCVVRTPEEWRAHPQGKLLVNTPLIEIEKVADGKPAGLDGETFLPLTGVNVLDFTHVLAGPRAMMGLAEFGANVLQVVPPHHIDPKTINLGVNAGKQSAFADLRDERDLRQFKRLLARADVFASSYRPSVIDRFHLACEKVVPLNSRGMVYLSVNAYGHEGPWKDRAGFDQNAQMVSGFAATEGTLDAPKPPPTFYINDLLTAYFGTAGVMAALLRRATEGGSYHVKISLTRSCMWAQDLGLIAPEVYRQAPESDCFPRRFTNDPSQYTYLPSFSHERSPYGLITRLAPPVKFSHLTLATLPSPVPYGSCSLSF